ncbi:MAG: hypothetical protein AAB434_07050 [Planctomycetota bacterium]
MRRTFVVPVASILIVLAVLLWMGGREDRPAPPRSGPSSVALPPASPAPGAPDGAPLIRELWSTPAFSAGENRVDTDLGPEDRRINHEAKEALVALEAYVKGTDLSGILDALCDAARADDGPRFDRMGFAVRWKIASGSPDWGLVEGFALDPARPLVARKAAIVALAHARRIGVRELVLGWFRDPRFGELRATLVCAATEADYGRDDDTRWQANEMLRMQALNAGLAGPATEPRTLQAPRSREVLDLVLRIAETERATECANMAISSLSGLLCEAQYRRDQEEGAPLHNSLLDAATLARVDRLLVETGRDARHSFEERCIALNALRYLPMDAARSSREMDCLAGIVRTDGDPDMRAAAAEDLHRFWPQSQGVLEKARHDPDARVREVVERTLGACAGACETGGE